MVFMVASYIRNSVCCSSPIRSEVWLPLASVVELLARDLVALRTHRFALLQQQFSDRAPDRADAARRASDQNEIYHVFFLPMECRARTERRLGGGPRGSGRDLQPRPRL